MRLFFAVTVNPVTRTGIDDFRPIEKLAGLRWVNPEQQHFTLCFLGEQAAASLSEIMAAGKSAANRNGPFRLRIQGTGFFPDRRRPRIFWIGVDAGAVEIVRLAADLRAELSRRSLDFDTRPFVPHLTLARIRGGLTAADQALLTSRVNPVGGGFAVTGFRLMESRLAATGSRYREVANFKLSGRMAS